MVSFHYSCLTENSPLAFAAIEQQSGICIYTVHSHSKVPQTLYNLHIQQPFHNTEMQPTLGWEDGSQHALRNSGGRGNFSQDNWGKVYPYKNHHAIFIVATESRHVRSF